MSWASESLALWNRYRLTPKKCKQCVVQYDFRCCWMYCIYCRHVKLTDEMLGW